MLGLQLQDGGVQRRPVHLRPGALLRLGSLSHGDDIFHKSSAPRGFPYIGVGLVGGDREDPGPEILFGAAFELPDGRGHRQKHAGGDVLGRRTTVQPVYAEPVDPLVIQLVKLGQGAGLRLGLHHEIVVSCVLNRFCHSTDHRHTFSCAAAAHVTEPPAGNPGKTRADHPRIKGRHPDGYRDPFNGYASCGASSWMYSRTGKSMATGMYSARVTSMAMAKNQ